MKIDINMFVQQITTLKNFYWEFKQILDVNLTKNKSNNENKKDKNAFNEKNALNFTF